MIFPVYISFLPLVFAVQMEHNEIQPVSNAVLRGFVTELETESLSYEADSFDYQKDGWRPGDNYDTARAQRLARYHVLSFNMKHLVNGPRKHYQLNEFCQDHEHLGGLFTHVRSNNSVENGVNGYIHFVKLAQPWSNHDFDLEQGYPLAIKTMDGYHERDFKRFRREVAINYIIHRAYPSVSGRYDPFLKTYAGGTYTVQEQDHSRERYTFLIMDQLASTLANKKYDLFTWQKAGLRRNPAMELHQFADYWNTIFSGIKWLHDNELCHRDIKPANVLMSERHFLEDGQHIDRELNAYDRPIGTKYVPKIIDFGYTGTARHRGKKVQMPFGEVKIPEISKGDGTFDWYAPEVATGLKGLQEEIPDLARYPTVKDPYHLHHLGLDDQMNYVSDYFSIGLVLFEKIYGEPLFGLGTEPGSMKDWKVRLFDKTRPFAVKDLAPIVKKRLQEKRAETEHQFPESFRFIFDILENCLEVSVVLRYEKTRDITQRFRGYLDSTISEMWKAALVKAQAEFPNASSQKHFDNIKRALFRGVYADGISVPGMEFHDRSMEVAKDLVAEQWKLAKAAFDQTEGAMEKYKWQILKGDTWGVVKIVGESHMTHHLQQRDQFRVVKDWHDQIDDLHKVLTKFLTKHLPNELGSPISPLVKWFSELYISDEYVSVLDFLHEKLKIPLEDLVPEKLTEQVVLEASAAIMSVPGLQYKVHELIERDSGRADRQTIIDEHKRNLFAMHADEAHIIPDLAVIQPAVSYLKFLTTTGWDTNLGSSIANKEQAIRTVISNLTKGRRSVESLAGRDLTTLVKIYIGEAKTDLLQKFQTLKRNRVQAILCSDTNLVAEILQRNPRIQLPIRVKRKVIYGTNIQLAKRGWKDTIFNKQLDLTHQGSLTNSVSNLVTRLDAHDLFLLLDAFNHNLRNL